MTVEPMTAEEETEIRAELARGYVHLNEADVRGFLAAIDALRAIVERQQAAISAADVAVAALPCFCPRHINEGAAQQDMRLPCFCPVVATRSAYDATRAALGKDGA